MTLFLGLDVGTQGTKGVVIDADRGEVVARAHRNYGLLEPEPGAAEQHPQTWLDAIAEIAAELATAARFDAVEGVGVSGQQHGLVVIDERGEVLRPAKLWCDTSTAAEARELSEAMGHNVPTGFTASKILWLKRNEPDHWRRTASVLLPHDYVNFVLTGDRRAEAGDASGTGFFDTVHRRFDVDEAAIIDPRLPTLLPELVEPGTPAGVLDARGAKLLGVREGVVVAAGGGDNMMSAIGSGATRAGIVVVSLGTSGTVFTHSDEPIVDPAGLIAPFCGSAGGWLPLLCVMNLTGVTEEVRIAFDLDHDRLSALAAAEPVGCDGLMWLPYLAGERVPDLPNATGTLLGMRSGHLRPGALFRAALEGTSLNLAWGVERMRELGIRVDQVRAVGGAATNALWRRILANVFDCPVTPMSESESGAVGAAIQALWTWRRRGGEDLTADEAARPFVRPGDEPTEPDAHRSEYAELLDRFRAEVRRVYGAD